MLASLMGKKYIQKLKIILQRNVNKLQRRLMLLLSVPQSRPTLWPHWLWPSLSIMNSQSLLKLMSIKSVMPSSHLIAYRAPTDPGSSAFSVISFCLFILFMGFSRQEYWRGLSLPSPVDQVLSEVSSMTCASWMTLHGMANSLTELDKAVVHVISLVSFLWLWFSFCLPSEGWGYNIA